MDRMDRLTPIFERFPPQAHVQFADHLCGAIALGGTKPVGHIHWLESGRLSIHWAKHAALWVTEPSMIFVPGPTAHRLDSTDGAQLVCAEFEFGQRYNNPLTVLGAEVIVIPIAKVPEIGVVHGLLMQEIFSERCGRSLAASQLLQYFLLILFRHLISTDAVAIGPLKALGDEKLLRAVTCIHREPARAWTIEQLAQVSAMSRATFARRFRDLMGKTMLEYLTDWRITLAQSLLVQGVPIKLISPQVGYTSTAVLTRVFTQRVGTGPRQWLLEYHTNTAPALGH
jgi:AraC-like DNA-binding protein